MFNKNKSFLCTVARMLVLILVFSLMLVGCEEETPKRDFPAVNQNPSGNSNNSNKNNNSNNNSNNNNNITKPNTSGKKRVAITYDDGPHNVNTVSIVDELSKYGFNATFFVVGNRIDGTEYNGSKALKYVASKGNEIAIHGYTHKQDSKHYYDTCSDATFESELGDTKDAILDCVPNAKIKLMRPVGGRIKSERVPSCGYAVIMWSVDSMDWSLKSGGDESVEKIVDNVMSQVQNGSIILMHDIYENTYLATKEILKQLNAQGYEVVTVSELLGSPKAGVKYSKAS